MNKMRCCLPFVFLLLIQKASLQEIQAFVGDSVILPCSNSNPALQSRPTVFWRYRDSGTVYDIIDGQEQLSEQEESYKKRVQSFPDQWKKGNFSIRFSKLKKADEGQYTCFIPSLGVETKLSLTVKDPPIQPDSKTNKGSGNGDVKSRPDCWLLILALLLGSPLLSA